MNNWCICWFFMYPLNAELNPICHLLALLRGATIVVVSRLRVNVWPVGDRLFGAPLKLAPGARAPLAPPKGQHCLSLWRLVQSQVTLCEICGAQIGTRKGFSSS